MQIILREHVDHLGRRGEVVNVADGYARNFLIPKGLAYKLTSGVRRQIEIESRAKAAKEDRERSAAEHLAAKLGDLQLIRFVRRAGETRAEGEVAEMLDIADELARKGFEIDKRSIRLQEPIKRIGTFRVSIHLYFETDVELIIEVEPEGGMPVGADASAAGGESGDASADDRDQDGDEDATDSEAGENPD